MRPRTEAAIALGSVTIIALLAALLGHSRATGVDTDQRASTFRAGPDGASALLEASRLAGRDVRRFRERTIRLRYLPPAGNRLLVELDPTVGYSAPETEELLAFARDNDLLLAGERADKLMRCFGYRVRPMFFDSALIAQPGLRSVWVHATLRATREGRVVDSSRIVDAARTSCSVPPFRSISIVLSSTEGAVAVRLERADNGHAVLLVSDPVVFRNRTLRDSLAGPAALALLLHDESSATPGQRYASIVFEEYHHGYGASGSLAAATIAWSVASPWGWMIWQLAVVGLLALLCGAVRFGAPRPLVARRRRSSLEHVRALATALSASHGHDEAIAAIIRGLRRRLAPPALRTRGDWQRWLSDAREHPQSLATAHAFTDLVSLTQPGQPSSSVLTAASTVEDLWQTLRP